MIVGEGLIPPFMRDHENGADVRSTFAQLLRILGNLSTRLGQ